MIFKGFKFGMILQLAIGPMCIFIFQTSIAHGFWMGEMGVVGTAVIDSLEIILAIIGIGVILKCNKKAEKFLKIFGVVILFLYGMNSILSVFNIYFLPNIGISSFKNSGNIFVKAVILALSDPLTIVFWAGIFSIKITEEKFCKKDLQLFAFGCILATLFFLSLISFIGSFTKQIIPLFFINIINFSVGLLMFYFAYKHIKTTTDNK